MRGHLNPGVWVGVARARRDVRRALGIWEKLLSSMSRTPTRLLCATLLLLGGGVAKGDVALAQSPMQAGPTLIPQGAPSSPTAPAPTAMPQPAAQAAPTTQPGAAPTEAARAAYDQAFQQSLEKPSDPATLVHFAELAVEIGDIEGAISALERLLLIDGSQPDVKLELGVLYYRLGSVEAARAYLQDVSESMEASTEAKERANTFLKAMKKP